MVKLIRSTSGIGGTVRVPGDKSISHRALILGAMCRGDLHIANLSPCADCAATVSCLNELGAEINQSSDDGALIRGQGRFGFREPATVLDAGNSGTTLRLLAGLLSGQNFFAVMTGDASLCERPMRRIIEPLGKMGAQIAARNHGENPPLAITGRELRPIAYTLPVASAQVKSAILIAGLLCRGTTTVIENVQSRDHTERMLEHLGAAITIGGNMVAVEGGDLRAKEIGVPGDISSALYFLAAGILLDGPGIRIRDVGLNPTRTGALDVLRNMGADLRVSNQGVRNGEPYGDIVARRSHLRAIDIPPAIIPTLIDEIPILALVATQAEGKTVIQGAQELRVKESDRLHTVAIELNRLGAAVVEHDDGLEIEGPTSLTGTTVQSSRDHRLVMTMAIAGLFARGETIIQDAESVEISYPEFFETLHTLMV